MKKIILIRYGELSTKGGNKNKFINLLVENLKKLTNQEIKIIKKHDRLYLETPQLEKTVKELKNIFGIQAIAIAYQTELTEKSIKEAVLKLTEKKAKTFKIVTKRANKNFLINSNQLNQIIGTYVLENSKLKVDIKKPDLTIKIEIREQFAYIYSEEEKGLGGYPVGIQGSGMLMLSGGLDSPVAGFLSLKRGIDLICLYFDSPPHTGKQALNKVIELAQVLNNYSGNIRLLIIPFTEIQEMIYKNISLDYNITIIRRMMYRISQEVATLYQAKIIINGESIGQVASQTLDSISAINEVISMPVIRPVACFDKLEIIELAKKIKTYDISIRPYQDCCTVFLAKHPVIKPSIKRCEMVETKLDYPTLIKEAIDHITEIDLEKQRSEWL